MANIFTGKHNYCTLRYGILLFLLCYMLPFSGTAQKYNLKETASGLKYHIIRKGTGNIPVRGDKVSIYYTSRLANDSVINKYDTASGTFSFLVGENEALKGIDEAVCLLNRGGKIYIEMPSQLAYGSRKLGKIPANSLVKAEVELVSDDQAFFRPQGHDTLTIVPGLKKLIVQTTNGDLPEVSNDITFNFTGYYINSNGERKIFDKSAPGQNLTFQLGGVDMIKGLDLALRTMRKGEKATFIIDPALAYKNEKKGMLPANTTIYLDIELLYFKNPFYEPQTTDTVTLPSGLKYLVVKQGSGDHPGRNDIASILYRGYILDSAGKRIIFDRSKDDKPFRYRIGSNTTLLGVNLGVKSMNIGAQYKLILPSQLAFKERHVGIIMPNTTVYYDVELKETTPMTFLNKGKTDTVRYASGLKMLNINNVQNGALADSNSTVTANFTGYYIDSTNTPFIFQNTLEDGKPYEFRLDRTDIIKGMKEALTYMHEGQVSKMFIPENLAYGQYGIGGTIPPCTDLVFDIEVIRIAKNKQ